MIIIFGLAYLLYFDFFIIAFWMRKQFEREQLFYLAKPLSLDFLDLVGPLGIYNHKNSSLFYLSTELGMSKASESLRNN